MATTDTVKRQAQERNLVLATRALFDERGMQDAPIAEVAKAAGLARGLVYRHFSSKEELYFSTVTLYLNELAGELEAAAAGEPDAARRLERLIGTFAAYCLRYPAFLDCSQSLMSQGAAELRKVVSDSVWLRLGQGMARSIEPTLRTLEAGSADGSFAIEDPSYTANVLWTQALGLMHLARMGVGVRQAAPGIPELFVVDRDRLVKTCVASALATVAARPG